MEHQKKHPTPRHLTATQAGPLPQDPTACLQPAPHAPPRSTPPHPEGHDSRTSSDTRSPAELVSVPPLSSVTNTRAPSKMRTLHGPCTALDQPPGRTQT
jgi:hypothetical protein